MWVLSLHSLMLRNGLGPQVRVVSGLLAKLPLPGLVLPSHSSSCRHFFFLCVNPSSLDTCSLHTEVLCASWSSGSVAQAHLGCVDGDRWCQVLYRLTAFVLDENGGVQVWCRINVTPVSQSCHGWARVTQRVSVPHSVLEVRCDVSFHDGSCIQQ